MRRLVPLLMLLAVLPATASATVSTGATVLVDRPGGDAALPSDAVSDGTASVPRAMTPDGRYVVFSSGSDGLLATDENSAVHVYRRDTTTGDVVQVDTSSTGGQPDPGSASRSPSISKDGTYVGFLTTASALAPGAGPGAMAFVVKDLATGDIEIASRGTGTAGTLANTQAGVVSGDGRHVAFNAKGVVDADNVDGVADQEDAYLRDLDTNVTHMMSTTTGLTTAGGLVSGRPAIDYSGDAVAFITRAALDTALDSDTSDDAYVHAMSAPERVMLVSRSDGGQAPNADSANEVDITGGSASLEVTWSANFIFYTPCLLDCMSPATRADHPQTGGEDNQGSARPSFPPPSNTNQVPTRINWITQSALSPLDTNARNDGYAWDIGNNNFDASIHLLTGGDEVGDGTFNVTATADGAVVLFDAEGPGLPGANGHNEQVFTKAGATVTNVGQPAGQAPTTSQSDDAGNGVLHSLSDDGHLVAFTTRAPAFGALQFEMPWLRDTQAGTTTALQTTPDGSAPNGSAFQLGLDGAGTKAIFTSDASNLVDGDANDAEDVFVRDVATGTTRLIDRTEGGAPVAGGSSLGVLSGDGHFAVVVSTSADMPDGPADNTYHVYRIDLATGATVLVDRADNGMPGNSFANQADINTDGSRIAFVSTATNLGGGTAGTSVYVRDLTNGTTTWLSTPEDADPAHDTSFSPSISGDGNRVAFEETNPGFGYGTTPTNGQVFVRDAAAKTTTLVSDGGTSTAGEASISRDGTRVVFGSNSQSLPGAVANRSNIYLRDLTTAAITLVSVRDGSTLSGRFGSAFNEETSGSISGSGHCVAFPSTSDDLVAGGYGSDYTHVFEHAIDAPCETAGTSTQPPPPPPAPDTTAPVLSKVSLTRGRFRLARKKTAVAAAAKKKKKKKKKPKRGTTVRFTLSERATVTIAVTQTRKVKHKKKRRTVTLVTLTRAKAKPGKNRVTFTGRYRKKQLKPGKYAMTLRAADAAGNRSKPRTLRFRVVR